MIHDLTITQLPISLFITILLTKTFRNCIYCAAPSAICQLFFAWSLIKLVDMYSQWQMISLLRYNIFINDIICLPIHLLIYLSLSLLIILSIHLLIYISIHLFNHLSIQHISVYLYIALFTDPSIIYVFSGLSTT